jgi:hypothetical protein
MTNKISCVLLAGVIACGAAGAARANVIEFTSTTPNPNSTGTANTGAFGSDANVSVSYSPYMYNWTAGSYGTIDGTGIAVYSDSSPGYVGVITFTGLNGYTITLNSFDLANWDGYSATGNVSVTGGQTTYNLPGQTPSSSTYTVYTPNETGSSLTLTVTNLYDIGINDISFTENAPVATPEPASLALLGGAVAALFGARRRKKA